MSTIERLILYYRALKRDWCSFWRGYINRYLPAASRVRYVLKAVWKK